MVLMQVPSKFNMPVLETDVTRHTVLVPFVLPEALILISALVVGPVFLHVGQELGAILRFEDGGDVAVLARVVAVLLVCAIAVIGP